MHHALLDESASSIGAHKLLLVRASAYRGRMLFNEWLQLRLGSGVKLLPLSNFEASNKEASPHYHGDTSKQTAWDSLVSLGCLLDTTRPSISTAGGIKMT
ncbi:hypothetical protein CCR75_005747 [Bremia lactucae]|uniref:Uncharacterized protein n=1 Tax=Bremia lactucae TaxID=4779 RepID=A0A976FRB8_BRELC|nr:hypothetical protein CCR75_005747 [Bremia lactucae]